MENSISLLHSPPARITFRGTERSAALEERARELTERLNRYHHHISDCRIIIQGPSMHHATAAFVVSFEISIPGGVIHASNGHTPRAEHADPYLALRDAFDNAKRQLQSFATME